MTRESRIIMQKGGENSNKSFQNTTCNSDYFFQSFKIFKYIEIYRMIEMFFLFETTKQKI